MEKTHRSKSRYAALAEQLEADIKEGKYPIDSLLPPETQLQKDYSVSRHTVRAALSQLHQLGLISSHRGIGTRIIARVPLQPKLVSLDSFDNLVDAIYQYVPEIVSCKEQVFLPMQLAQDLKISEKKAWIEITVLRKEPQTNLPVLIDRIYIDEKYAGFQNLFDGKESVIIRLRQQYRTQIVQMEQRIQAVGLEQSEADLLKEKLGAPVLKIIRFLFNEQKELAAFSIKWYHTKRSTFTSHFQLIHPVTLKS